MSLKVMCAGCSVEERERAEADVRRALGARAAGSETWTVSVINLQSRWSITLDGPGTRALNCTAQPGRLAEAIQEALQAKTAASPPAAPTPVTPHAAPAPARPAAPPTPTAGGSAPSGARSAISPASGPRRDRHECHQCHHRFGVMFEAVAGEREHMTPVACPHCWHMNHVLVGETAADTSDFRAAKD